MNIVSAIKRSYYTRGSRIYSFKRNFFTLNGITKWIHGWEKNGWQTLAKQEVANRALWQNLVGLVREREKTSKVSWHYVPGHVGVVGNERCDEIATNFAEGKQVSLFRGKLSEYSRNVLNFSIDETLQQEKSEKRAKSNAKAYSYLSLIDGVVMRHATWAECEARVKGKKAKFKKSISAEDEKAILADWNVSL
jgi:ribonuclease HI